MSSRRDFVSALFAAIKPDDSLLVSAWAEKHRILPKDSPEPGPWRNKRTPYLVEIMDSLSPRGGVREVYLKKGHQLGGSALGENFLGCAITSAAGNILAVFATLEDAEKWELSRLEPMRSSTPDLRRRIRDADVKGSDNTKRRKKFPGGFMQLVGANRPGALKSSTMRYVLLEEMDEYAGDIGDQGAPETLAKKRTSNFGNKARIFGNSTPTIEGASPIDRNFKRGDQRRFFVPCPECGEFQYFEWKNFKWPEGNPSGCGYACSACGVVSTEAQWKVRGYQRAHWRPTAVGEPGVRSYHLPSFYAPLGWRSWTSLAAEFEACHKDPVELKAFVNNEMAECWQDQSKSLDEDAHERRAGGYAVREIPPGCLVVTMAVDVQAYRLEYKAVGWGRNRRMWVLDYAVIEGNPARSAVWDELTRIRSRPFQNQFGQLLRPTACGIDSGGHHTNEVYAYARMHQHEGVFALKGESARRKAIIGRPTPVDIDLGGHTIKGGVLLWKVGTDTAKDALFGWLKHDEEAPAGDWFVHFPAGLSKEYFRQLSSEVFDEKRQLYVKKSGRRNEAIDLFVYNIAAAHHPRCRLDAMRESDWAHLEQIFEPRQDSLFLQASGVDTPAPVNGAEPVSDKPAPAVAPEVAARSLRPAPVEQERVSNSDWLAGHELIL